MTQYSRPTKKGVSLITQAQAQADALSRTVSALHDHYRGDDRCIVLANDTGRVCEDVTRLASQIRIMHVEDSGLREGKGKP